MTYHSIEFCKPRRCVALHLRMLDTHSPFTVHDAAIDLRLTGRRRLEHLDGQDHQQRVEAFQVQRVREVAETSQHIKTHH